MTEHMTGHGSVANVTLLFDVILAQALFYPCTQRLLHPGTFQADLELLARQGPASVREGSLTEWNLRGRLRRPRPFTQTEMYRK